MTDKMKPAAVMQRASDDVTGKVERAEHNALVLVRSNSLTDLAARIQQEHDAVAGALKSSLAHAMTAGDLLVQAKAQVPHGQWLPWLRDHCHVSERMAQRYIRLARNRAVIEAKCDTVSDLGVRGALTLISANRSSSADDFVTHCFDLADCAAENAFNMEDYFDTPKVERQILSDLIAEARAAIESLPDTWPEELSDLIERETQDVFTRFKAACGEYRAASAADMGLSVDELDQLEATIEHAKSQGADKWKVAHIAAKKHPDFWHRDPLPGPTPTAVLTHVRDLANEWLRQAEIIVVREGGRGGAAS